MKETNPLKSEEKIEKYNIFVKICTGIRNIGEDKQFLCLDTESVDTENENLTEIGWCIFKKNGSIIKKKHTFIKENINNDQNSNLDPQNVEIQELSVIKKELVTDIENVNYIVGHEIDKILTAIGTLENIDIISKFTKIKDSVIPEYGIIDTNDLCFGGSLDKSLKGLKYPYEKSFNAGEDVMITMEFLLKIVYNDFAKLINAIRNNISENRFFICFNIESNKNNPNQPTELGWCIFQKDGTIKKKKHVIIKENMDNDKSIPENDDHYLIGKPEIQDIDTINEELKSDLKEVNYMVSQKINHDLNLLKTINIDVSRYIVMSNNKVPQYGIINIMDLYAGTYYSNCQEFEQGLKKLDIPCDNLDNAGNKTYYIMQFFLKLIDNDKPEKYKDCVDLIDSIKNKIDNDKLYLCLDIEAYEREQKLLTEFGWCIFKKDGTIIKNKHAIVKENMKYRNGIHVPDNRDNFLFGKSEIQELKEIEEELKIDVAKVNFLVGQGVISDIRFFNKINFKTSNFKKMNSATVPEYGIIDTMDLYSGHFLKQGVSLEKSLIKLKIPYDKLHNAGNDANYTMQVFLKIINGTIDTTKNITQYKKEKGNGYEKFRRLAKIINAIQHNISKSKLYLSFDIEEYEQNKKLITEIGWCIFKKDGTIRKKKHAIVKENIDCRNTKKKQDNKDNYLFGESDVQELKVIEEELRKDVEKVSYLVSHGIGKNDIRYLKSIKVNITRFIKMKGSKVPHCGLIDTMDLYAGLFNSKGVNLEKSLTDLEIPFDKLYNAGNNAMYTMQIFLKIINQYKGESSLSKDEKTLRSITNYMQGNTTKQYISNIVKQNKEKVKKEKKEDPNQFKEQAKLIERVRTIDNEKLYLCLDIEAYEFDQKKLTEFGWCIFKKDGTIVKKKHTNTKEYLKFRNGKHVPDNKDNFLFGNSDVQELAVVEEELKEDIESVNYLVGHGIKSDIRYLKSINVNTTKFENMKTKKIPEYGVIDTMDVYSGHFNTKGVSLEKCLIKLRIPFDKLHNAGNDAMFTMQVFLKIINNSEKVSLQLSDDLIKESNDVEKTNNNNKTKEETKAKENKDSSQVLKQKKSKEKIDETKLFQEFSKLIEGIRSIDNEKLYLCLDIEAFEFDQKKLTEFGWCIFKRDGTIVKKKHTNTKEYLKFRNGKHVPDNKNHFLFGTSEVQELAVVEEELKNDIESVNFLVGHGIKSDINYLKSINVNTSKFETMKSQKIPEFGVIDTMDIYSGQFNTKGVSLEKCLIKLQIPYDRLHNAGNDAMFTMQVFLKIINNSETVPLQLPKELLKDNTNDSGKDSHAKKSKDHKDGSDRLREYSKLINAVRNNINKNKLYLCMDIEAYEQNQSILTEFGWCLFKRDGSITKKKHAIVKENMNYRNGKRVQDNRDHYLFGESETQELKVIEEELKSDIEKVEYIVGHGVSNDIRYLKSIGINIDKFICMKGSKVEKHGVIDTMDLYAGFFRTQGVSLEKSLIKLQIPFDKLHNAGNDTIFTVQVFLKIVNNCKEVPLQLPPEFLKKNEPQKGGNKTTREGTQTPTQKSKKHKNDMERFKEYEKLINTIRHNINRNKLYLSLDIEAFEQNQKILKEFGWCIFKKDGTITKTKHAIVKENMNYHNEKNVPDNRNYYLFGDSEVMELKAIEEELRKDIDRVSYLVGQGINNDLRFLKFINIDTSKFVNMKNSQVPKYGLIDTMDLNSGYYLANGLGLEKSLIKLQIPYDKLHNSGNDAIFTMQVFMKIVNDSKTVPLQLTEQQITEVNNKSKEDDLKNAQQTSKQRTKKHKDEAVRYDDFEKLINSIKFNIGKNKLFICFDIEAYELDHKILTEFGWCIFKKDGTIIKEKHAIVKEHMDYRNGTLVPDNRDNYLFGTSVIEELKVIEEELRKDIESVNYLVGQGITNDLRYLKSINIDTTKFVAMKNSKIPKFGVIDTMDLYSGMFYTQGVSLEKSLLKLKIPYDKLHNGGNDTIFTMQVFMKIINNSKKVPLQLPKKLLKQNNEKFKNEKSIKENEESSKAKTKKQKEEVAKYDDFAKLINTIKFNIGNSRFYLCLDIEAYENNQSILTEFGWCIFKKDGTITKKKHAIVKENMNYHNGKKVPDHRDHYLFGESEIQELKVIEEELKADIESVNYLVGQGINNDIRYLKSIHVNTDKFISMKNSKVQKFGIIDTMDLYSGYFNLQAVSLEKSLIKLHIPFDKLHNGGNDSIFTMQVFLKIVCGLKKVPLELPKEFLKEDKEALTGNDATPGSPMKENKSKSKEGKDESEIFEDYSKLISTIRFNIGKNKLFMGIDVKATEEEEPAKLLELGWCIFEKDGTVTKKKHIIFKENTVENQPSPDDYLFGTTEVEATDTIVEELKKDIEGINYLIGQDIENSLRCLKLLGINISKFVVMKTPKIHKYGAIDTRDLFSGQYSTKYVNLEESLKRLQIPFDKLDNSGNATIYAMQIFFKIVNDSKKVPLQLKKAKAKENSNTEETETEVEAAKEHELNQADLLKN